MGYIGVRAKDLGDWASYGSNFLGLQRIDKSRSTLAFRMDDRKQRLVVDADGGQGIGFFGWEVADASALDAMAARIEASGTKVARGSRALADERRVKDLIVLNDPAGNRLEIFYGAETTTDPFKPGRNISGFRTGPLGMGHVVMHFERIADVMSFLSGRARVQAERLLDCVRSRLISSTSTRDTTASRSSRAASTWSIT